MINSVWQQLKSFNFTSVECTSYSMFVLFVYFFGQTSNLVKLMKVSKEVNQQKIEYASKPLSFPHLTVSVIWKKIIGTGCPYPVTRKNLFFGLQFCRVGQYEKHK